MFSESNFTNPAMPRFVRRRYEHANSCECAHKRAAIKLRPGNAIDVCWCEFEIMPGSSLTFLGRVRALRLALTLLSESEH